MSIDTASAAPASTPTASAATPEAPQNGATRDIRALFEEQGQMSAKDYLLLTNRSNRLAEFIGGYVEVLAMPTYQHQKLVMWLLRLFQAFVDSSRQAEVAIAPLRVRLPNGHFREPDLVLMLRQNLHRAGNEYWEGADLAVEVVSEGAAERDWELKRLDYAAAGIPEYWIVDPQKQVIAVGVLNNSEYALTEYPPGQFARSVLLPGFQADVAAVFAAATAK